MRAAQHAGAGADRLFTGIPGPNPVLRSLLDAGFVIAEQSIFMATSPDLVDPCATTTTRVRLMDLRLWIVTDHDVTCARFVQSVRDIVPVERWKERPATAAADRVPRAPAALASGRRAVVGDRPMRRCVRVGGTARTRRQGCRPRPGETEVPTSPAPLELEHLDACADAVTARAE
jgi:hypothetical protein